MLRKEAPWHTFHSAYSGVLARAALRPFKSAQNNTSCAINEISKGHFWIKRHSASKNVSRARSISRTKGISGPRVKKHFWIKSRGIFRPRGQEVSRSKACLRRRGTSLITMRARKGLDAKMRTRKIGPRRVQVTGVSTGPLVPFGNRKHFSSPPTQKETAAEYFVFLRHLSPLSTGPGPYMRHLLSRKRRNYT